MATSVQLREKARRLRALARDLDALCDDAFTSSQGGGTDGWDSPNATEVRAGIKAYRASAQGAAADIRAEAATVDQQAADKEAEEDAAAAHGGKTVPTAY
jgi:hypothetical protein